jgi:hypothetical protein
MDGDNIMRSQLFVAMLSCLTGVLVACEVVGGEVEYSAYGVLDISVNTWGEVEFKVNPGLELPTPLGTFGAGVVVEPTNYFKDDDVVNTLTIRKDGQDTIYDLHGQDFDVTFEAGYYQMINFQKRGKDLFLEIETGNVNQPAYLPPTNIPATRVPPTSRPPTNNNCPNAPTTFFSVGDTVIVDFNSGGALRVMTIPHGGPDHTIVQAYDNDELVIIDGPVCGFNGDRWMWKVYFPRKGVEGWSPEGVHGDKWMCPVNNPECGS